MLLDAGVGAVHFHAGVRACSVATAVITARAPRGHSLARLLGREPARSCPRASYPRAPGCHSPATRLLVLSENVWSLATTVPSLRFASLTAPWRQFYRLSHCQKAVARYHCEVALDSKSDICGTGGRGGNDLEASRAAVTRIPDMFYGPFFNPRSPPCLRRGRIPEW